MSTVAQKPPEEWIKRLGRDDQATVTRAQRKLVEQLENEETRDEAAGALLDALGAEEVDTRHRALMLLTDAWWPPAVEMSMEGLEAILSCLADLELEDPQELEATALLLATLTHQESALLPRLVEAMDHPGHTVRWAAVATLARCEVSPRVLPRLERALDDPHPAVRAAALEAIAAQASVDPAFSAPLLLAQAVARGGSERFSSLTAVRLLLEREDPPDALKGLQDPQSLLALLEDESAPIRMESLYLLRLLARSDEETLQAVRKLLRDPLPDVVANAAVTLLELVKGDAQALGTLGTMLCSTSERDAGAALVALDLGGPRLVRRAGPALELAMSKAPLADVKRDLRRLMSSAAKSRPGPASPQPG